MDQPKTQNPPEVCHRCLEPVPPKLSRCPRCGEPIHRTASIRKILGFLGLLIFLAVALLAFRLLHTKGGRPVVVEDDDRTPTEGRPDTPPPPEKKPALGQ